jgi:hypothetical protein
VLSARGRRRDAERLPFERNPGTPGVDPLDTRVTTFVVDNLGDTAPVHGMRRVSIVIVLFHGPQYDSRPRKIV